MSRIRVFAIAVALLAVSFFGIYVGSTVFSGKSKDTGMANRAPERFIVPAVVSPSSASPKLLGLRVSLEKELRAYVDEREQDGSIPRASIFFRNLSTGATIGINESADFSPASLLKLPVAMWFFKQEDQAPGFLAQEVEFTGPNGVSVEHFPGKRGLRPGTTYTLLQLNEFLLQESDNDASAILSEYAGGREKINSVYTDLGMEDVADYNTYIIDVHTYAAFFQILYSARYLSRSSSNTLLEMLTHASFVQGLVAGVPDSVPVSHKFGERTINQEESLYQLHDCGIVYASEFPYLLCVMTQAKDYENAANFIASVSRKTYEAVSRSL